MSSKRTRIVVLIGVLSALSWVLMALEFPLFIYFPSYLKVDFSDLPAIFSGIIAGPMAAVVTEFIKNLLHFFTMSKEGGIGEIANFAAGVGMTVPVAIIVRKNDKRIWLGLICGIIGMTVIANLVNYFITLPLYMKGADNKVLLDTILAITIPFNIVKGIMVSVVTYFLHMLLKGVIKKYRI
jgi:riboflavin transporter FmnP